MSEQPRNRELLEGIESCRPGSDDLQTPELSAIARQVAEDPEARQLYEAVQQSDAALAEAFHDVAVPQGLAQRLLHAIESSAEAVDSGEPTDDLAAGRGTPDDRPLDPSDAVELSHSVSQQGDAGKPRPSRRRFALAATACLLIVVGVSLVAVMTRPAIYREQAVFDQADEAFSAIEPDAWTNVRWQPMPEARPLSRRVRGEVVAWQHVRGLGDRRAVAVRFSDPRVTLLIFRPDKSVQDLPSVPPRTPRRSAEQSSGTNIGAWQSEGMVYVLMVRGPRELYQRTVTGTPEVALQVRPQSFASRHNT